MDNAIIWGLWAAGLVLLIVTARRVGR